LICILYFGCSKSKQPGPQNGNTAAIKITLVSGSGQTDTIGQTLLSPVVVKVTQNGIPVSGYTVQFSGSGCNSDQLVLLNTQTDGTLGYNWSLAGDLGQQTLKIYAENSQNVKVDSATALATGIPFGPGWHYSACSFQGGDLPTAFCKLSTGRLFTSYTGGKAYLRYSDDNGISWNAVKSLGNRHYFDYILSTPADEIFAFTIADGPFYSSDGGQTWTAFGVAPFSNDAITDAVYTPTGKILVTTNQNPICISSDKGKTWTNAAFSLFNPTNATGGESGFNEPAEDKNGNLYVVGQESGTIYKSADNGATWTPLLQQGYERDYGLSIDNNNTFYKSRGDASGGGIYISKDNGTSYTQLISISNSFIEHMTIQSDGNFYYDNLSAGLYMANGVSSSVKQLVQNQLPGAIPYIVAKNNNIIIVNPISSSIKYYQK
jgi:photosystem II stability/assembly factor-like uncharacterized protein